MTDNENEYSEQIAASLSSIEKSVEIIANCLGLFILQASELKDAKSTEKILFLNSLGFDRNIIASIVGTTPGTVSVRISEAKKKSK